MLVRSSIANVTPQKVHARRITAREHEVQHFEFTGQVTTCTSLFKLYLKCSNVCSQICEGKYVSVFQGIVVVNIIVAGLLVGLQTYQSLSDNKILDIANNVVLAIFILEFVLKFVAEGDRPWNHFTGPEASWNIFDLAVIILCLPFLSGLTGKNFPVVRLITRLFRLARITRLLHEVPTLRVLFEGLMSGIRSISYIFILLMLLFYLYSVVGVVLYRYSDPFYFRSIPVAFMTLFRATTLEGWTACLATTRLGCDKSSGGVYFTESQVSAEVWGQLPAMYKCERPQTYAIIGILYWVSFTVVSSLIMLSLFIAVITINMQQTLDIMQKEVEEVNKRKLMLKKTKELVDNVVDDEEEEEEQAAAAAAAAAAQAEAEAQGVLSPDGTTATAASEIGRLSARRPTGVRFSALKGAVAAVTGGGSGSELQAHNSDSTKSITGRQGTGLKGKKRMSLVMSIQEQRKHKKMLEMRTLLMQAWSGTTVAEEYHADLDQQQGIFRTIIRRFTLLAAGIVEAQWFTNFIIVIILLTSVLVGVQLDQPGQVSSTTNFVLNNVIENFIYAVFVTEVVLRMAAEEFNLIEYFSSAWNVFDFLVVAVSKVPGAGSQFVVILRLVRILRVLKLIKSLPQLAVIVNALLIGVNSITYVGVLMFLMYYVFAIFAVLLFNRNDPFHFATLHMSLYSLFNIATLNNWGDVMYTAVYGCDVFPPMNTCDHPTAFGVGGALYFCVFIVIGSFVLLTLFVGVVTTSMEEATKIQTLEREMEQRALDLCNANSISHKELSIYRHVFGMLDLDGSGTIESAELLVGLGCLNIHPTEEELKSWIVDVDINNDGVIDVVEFVTFMIAMKTRKMEATNQLAKERAERKERRRQRRRERGEAEDENGNDSDSSSGSSSSSSDAPVLEPIVEEEEDGEDLAGAEGEGKSTIIGSVGTAVAGASPSPTTAHTDIFAPYISPRSSQKLDYILSSGSPSHVYHHHSSPSHHHHSPSSHHHPHHQDNNNTTDSLEFVDLSDLPHHSHPHHHLHILDVSGSSPSGEVDRSRAQSSCGNGGAGSSACTTPRTFQSNLMHHLTRNLLEQHNNNALSGSDKADHSLKSTGTGGTGATGSDKEKDIISVGSGSNSGVSTPTHAHQHQRRRHSTSHGHGHGHSHSHSHSRHTHAHAAGGGGSGGHTDSHNRRRSFNNSITEGLAELSDMNFMARDAQQQERSKTLIATASEGIEHELGAFTHSLARMTQTVTTHASDLAHLLTHHHTPNNSSNHNSAKKDRGRSHSAASSNQEHSQQSNFSSKKNSDKNDSDNEAIYNSSYENEDNAETVQAFALGVEESLKLSAQNPNATRPRRDSTGGSSNNNNNNNHNSSSRNNSKMQSHRNETIVSV